MSSVVKDVNARRNTVNVAVTDLFSSETMLFRHVQVNSKEFIIEVIKIIDCDTKSSINGC